MLRNVMGHLVILFLCAFIGAAHADILNGFELFPLLDAPSWEASTPQAAEIKDQGKFPFCGLYAMATFLEIWGDASHTGYLFPPIDESYLALGYNRVVGSPGMGISPTWLGLTTQIFGAIPKAAKFSGKADQWPMKNWQTDNMALVDTKVSDPLLTGKFVWGKSTTEFTGPTFLKDTVGIDMRNLYPLHTSHKETYLAETSPHKEEAAVAPFRLADAETTAKSMQKIALKMGTDTRMSSVDPDVLYKAAKLQLNARRPLLLTINAGLTQNRFHTYGVITDAQLMPLNKGRLGPHAVVAVAHCDKANSVDRICRRFNRYLEQKQISECIAVQNSWGPTVNERGYFCLAPDAWERVAMALFIEKNLVKTKP